MFLELKDFIKRGRENKEGNGGRLKSLPVFVAFNSQLHPLACSRKRRSIPPVK